MGDMPQLQTLDASISEDFQIPLLRQAGAYLDRLAIADEAGEYTYRELVLAARRVAGALLAGREDLRESRVAFMVAPGFAYQRCSGGSGRPGVSPSLCVCRTHFPSWRTRSRIPTPRRSRGPILCGVPRTGRG